MREDTAEGNGGADESVEFLIATDCELEMTGRDTLHFEIFCGVAGKLEDFGGEVFEDSGDVDGS